MNVQHPVYQRDIQEVLNGNLPFEMLKGCTIAVTGATGMIGACLCDVLIEANRRFGLELKLIAMCRNGARAKVRFDYALDREVTVLEQDLTEPLKALPKVDYIVHAASNAHPLAMSADPIGTMRANFLGTMNLLEQLDACGGKRLMFISTGEIYGENPAVADGFREDSYGRIDLMNPRSCYPESKRAAETLCASYIRQRGVDAVVARLCYVYGPTVAPGNSRADAQFLRNVLKGEDIVLKSAGAQLRSYCYVVDAVAALLTILLKGGCGEAYNVANRNSTATIRGYAETLARLGGVQIVFDLPPEVERQGYSTVSRAVQNPAKLEQLGWTARHALESGLGHTLQILRDGGCDFL